MAPVILFHAGFGVVDFVGVDVFFVISGYLITMVLIEDIEKQFSIVYFYERRVRRILPALYMVMAFSIFVAWILLSDAALNKFGNGLLGVTLFVSNIILAARRSILMRLQSLTLSYIRGAFPVEEQYYLLFPLFLVIAWRFGKTEVFWMIIGMLILSLLLSEWRLA